MSNATAIAARQFGKRRRDRNRAAGRCVNDTVAATHGPIVAHARCQSCFNAKVEADRPSSIECPQCFAPPMKPCRASNGVGAFTRCHKVRAELARRKAA